MKDLTKKDFHDCFELQKITKSVSNQNKMFYIFKFICDRQTLYTREGTSLRKYNI